MFFFLRARRSRSLCHAVYFSRFGTFPSFPVGPSQKQLPKGPFFFFFFFCGDRSLLRTD